MQDYSDDGFEEEDEAGGSSTAKAKVLGTVTGQARKNTTTVQGPSQADVMEVQQAMRNENAAAKARSRVPPAASHKEDGAKAGAGEEEEEAKGGADRTAAESLPRRAPKRPAPRPAPVRKYLNFGADLQLSTVKANDPRKLRLKDGWVSG